MDLALSAPKAVNLGRDTQAGAPGCCRASLGPLGVLRKRLVAGLLRRRGRGGGEVCLLPVFFPRGLHSEDRVLIMVRVQAGIPEYAGKMPRSPLTLLWWTPLTKPPPHPPKKPKVFLNDISHILEQGSEKMSDRKKRMRESPLGPGLAKRWEKCLCLRALSAIQRPGQAVINTFSTAHCPSVAPVFPP